MILQIRNCLIVLGLALSAFPTSRAQAGTYSVIRSFQASDGCCQQTPGMLDQYLDGSIFGTNPAGGSGFGTVVQYSPFTGIFSAHSFTGDGGGNSPQSGITWGVDWNLYGTTRWGGNQATYAPGFGTVFRYVGNATAPTVIYSFNNGADGAFPFAPPVQTQDASLWGVTYNGSTPGTWYKIDNSGNLLGTGKLPSLTTAPLHVSQDGNLYGTTPNGSDPSVSYNQGTVYKLSQSGVLTVIHSFNPGMAYEGLNPTGAVMEGADGFLYGTTCGGGQTSSGLPGTAGGLGTVFMVSRDGSTFRTIHAFQDNATVHEGSCPIGALVQGTDSKLYGTTSRGGGGSNTSIQGVLFRLNTDGSSFEVLHLFDAANGNVPGPGLFIHTTGVIYGTTTRGGQAGLGVLWGFDAHLPPFARMPSRWSGPVGTWVNVIGQGFTSATSVLVGGVAVPWTKVDHPNIVADTFMQVKVPAGAHSGPITIVEPNATLVTRETFNVTACNLFVTKCL